MIRVIDDFLEFPNEYRASILERDFRTYDFGPDEKFHGICLMALTSAIPGKIRRQNPEADIMLSFLRKSPAGQVEPHLIHTDIDMGFWTALLYLNPDPPAGDGTKFWRHEATGAIESMIPHERSEEGKTTEGWTLWRHVEAKFNRMVIWPAQYFHSRAIADNWGTGDDSRLTQVTFGRGSIL